MFSGVDEKEIVASVARCFYAIVPAKYQTYCNLTARIAHAALQRFGVRSELLPCQLWYAGPEKNHVIGFIGRPDDNPAKWDGHVICATRAWFIDAAVAHLRMDLGVQVPPLIAGKRFVTLPSQAIARWDVSLGERVWWYRPPPGFDTTVPDQPPELVARYGDALYEHARQQLAVAAG